MRKLPARKKNVRFSDAVQYKPACNSRMYDHVGIVNELRQDGVDTQPFLHTGVSHMSHQSH